MSISSEIAFGEFGRLVLNVDVSMFGCSEVGFLHVAYYCNDYSPSIGFPSGEMVVEAAWWMCN